MTDVNEDQLEAFIAAAESGTECDGVSAELTDERFRVETPETTHEGLTEPALREIADRNPWLVSNWYYWNARDRPETEIAFLRHLEGADDRSVSERYEAMADGGIVAAWGQLHIEITLREDGHRAYTVRNEADADSDVETLEVHTDPLRARQLVKHDDRGRYRPLKTAPTLPTGWAFVDLGGPSLAETVEYVYPATIANWYLERRGELDVDHWRETM